jgi:low affinity Fe/Cu permease
MDNKQFNSLGFTDGQLKYSRAYGRFSNWVSRKAGSPAIMILAFLLIIVWGLTGPIFHFSNTWQLVINTGTTVITFLMVFIIQQSQNKDTAAIHLKLNELIACNKKASNRLVDIEDLTEEELLVLKRFYVELSDKAERHKDLYSSHSLDEAEDNQERKLRRIQQVRKGNVALD